MIVYASTKKGFTNDVLSGEVEDRIHASYVREMGFRSNASQIRAWRESSRYINDVLNDPAIPEDAGVAIEYKIPGTSNRIDFVLSGLDAENRNSAIIIELKQWETAKLTDMDAIVETYVGGGMRQERHPSYQAWTYARLLKDFNDTIEKEDIQLQPCAYLHNYKPDEVITNEFYAEHTAKAPVFLRTDAEKLRDFIKRYVKYGDKNEIMYKIDGGKLRPSKNLADSLANMLHGNQEFLMIDDQKLVFETAKKLALESTSKNKNVFIVEGGPGTGKSVVAINLLVALTEQGQMVQYVTRNAAPREVYHARLTGSIAKTRIANMFKGSSAYYDAEKNSLSTLIVDEAHRLNEKSGLYGIDGLNQIMEIIRSAKCSIFFIDEDQRVTLKDIGESSEIAYWAAQEGATIHRLSLTSQFRCNGSDGYLAWLDNALQISGTANETLDDLDYDFQVFDSPAEVRERIYARNGASNRARMVAGYCWDWKSKKDKSAMDIMIDDFAAQWNLASDGPAWIIKPNSVKEIGCIHTCQGLEVEYIGVIIGPDLIVRNGKIITDATKRSSMDQSIRGYKKMHAEDPAKAEQRADQIIKNTYRTLMTRGQRGCYLYCTDPETRTYFRQQLISLTQQDNSYTSGEDTSLLTQDG